MLKCLYCGILTLALQIYPYCSSLSQGNIHGDGDKDVKKAELTQKVWYETQKTLRGVGELGVYEGIM